MYEFLFGFNLTVKQLFQLEMNCFSLEKVIGHIESSGRDRENINDEQFKSRHNKALKKPVFAHEV